MTDTMTIELPHEDRSMLTSLAKRLGWKLHTVTKKKTSYEQALDDIEHGRLTEYASVDDLFNKLGAK